MKKETIIAWVKSFKSQLTVIVGDIYNLVKEIKEICLILSYIIKRLDEQNKRLDELEKEINNRAGK
jgi:uncharacterized coiled-coil DUF342 family protein